MGLNTRYLPWLACAAAAAIGIPAFAYGDPAARGSDSQAPGTINAVDFAFENPANGESEVTINAGETVTFAYPTGGNVHNVDFFVAAPTSCVQTAGNDLGPVPPLPAMPAPTGWVGNCRFDTPGTYQFVCEAHPDMEGTVV